MVVQNTTDIVSNKQMLLTPNPGYADSLFLYFLFSSEETRKRILDNGIGSSVPGFNLGQLRSFEILLPSLPEQRAIADILGTLDDKIEVNRRMNETLEAMARALFKSWFVDFDPVRAKMIGRKTRLPKPVADLFPSSFEDSEMGKTPKGWRVVALSDLCSTQYGYTASSSKEPVGPRYLRVMDINKKDWIEWNKVPYCRIDQQAAEKYQLCVGDIVVARMADPGKSAIIEESLEVVFASYLVRLKTKTLSISRYIYGFLKSDRYREYSQNVKSGSVQANMNAKVIVGAKLILPSPEIIESYSHEVEALRDCLRKSNRESLTIASLRDTLLPKLISGELRVKDAERFIGSKL